MSDLNVIQNPDAPVAPEVLADAIRRIAGGFDRLKLSRLNRAAIETLVYDATRGVKREEITRVLDALESLARRYTTPAK